MTRLLAPEMFGVMSIAVMISTGLAMLSDLGLKPNIVQNARGNEASFLNTAWILQVYRSLIIAALMISIAGITWLAGHLGGIARGSAYADPSLPYVLGALSLTVIVGGFESTKTFQASRNLLIARIAFLEVISQIAGFLVMAAYAVVGRSIWALVLGAITSACVRTAMSHMVLPGSANRWQWDNSAYADIVRLGRWLFLSSILYFIATSGDRILLGALIDPASLGAYAIAFLIFSAVDQILTKINADVSFPALSEVVRDRPQDLAQSYYKFHFAIASAAYFCAGVLLVSGDRIISVLYDSRYQQAGSILQILAIALLAYPFRVATQTFLALGLARIYFQLHVFRIAALFVAVPLGFHFMGLHGAIYGVVISYFASVPTTLKYANENGLFDLRKELMSAPAIGIGAAVGMTFNLAVAHLFHF